MDLKKSSSHIAAFDDYVEDNFYFLLFSSCCLSSHSPTVLTAVHSTVKLAHHCFALGSCVSLRPVHKLVQTSHSLRRHTYTYIYRQEESWLKHGLFLYTQTCLRREAFFFCLFFCLFWADCGFALKVLFLGRRLSKCEDSLMSSKY